MIPAVHLTRRFPRARDTYGPFESVRAAVVWKRDVWYSPPPGIGELVAAELIDGTGLDLTVPFDTTTDQDAPGDWETTA